MTIVDPVQAYFGRFMLEFEFDQECVVRVILDEQKSLVRSFLHIRISGSGACPGAVALI